MKYLLAHDLGTSGNKAALFSAEGRLIGSVTAAYNVRYFNRGWAEQNAEDWWGAVCKSTRALLSSTGVDKNEIACISFSGQMMGCLCVDRAGTPLRPAIIWADQRAAKQAERLNERISQQAFYRIVGHRNTASYGVQKLMWVRDNEPEVYENTYKALNAKDYIVLKLTGNFCTDYSDANSMACFDLKRLAWSDELVACAGIDGDKLPTAYPSTYVAGHVLPEAAERTGLAAGTPVVMGAGDGVAASVGAGSVAPGKTYCCMGTSAWITTASERPVYDEGMRTVTWAHAIPGLYAPNGTMQTAGGAYSWLKNTVCLHEIEEARRQGGSPYDYMNREIAQSPPGANGVVFLPYLLGERAPRWNPEATGAFLGLKSENTRADLLRSVLEGVTLNLNVILTLLRRHIPISEIVAIGGGARGEGWRQMMADVFQTRILAPTLLEEAGSMGAAVIGGVSVGLFSDFTAIDRFMQIASVQTPDPAAAVVYEKEKPVFEACYDALCGVFPRL